jgi:hypothetical protein
MANPDAAMARREQLVAEWRVSGRAKAAFARRHGVHPRTFWGRCREAAEPPAGAGGPAPVFVPVTVMDPDDSGARELEIVLTSGDRVCPRVAHARLAGPRRGGAAARMLTLSPLIRVYLATGATDLRRSIDGLAALVRERFAVDPLFCGGPRSVASDARERPGIGRLLNRRHPVAT